MPNQHARTVLSLLNRFRAHLDARVVGKTLEPKTRGAMEYFLEVAEPLYDVRTEKLSDKHLDAWVRSLADRPGTQRRAAAILRQAFLWGRREGLVVGDPTFSIRKLLQPHKRGEPFTHEQMGVFIGGCRAEARRRGGKHHLGRLYVARQTASARCLEAMALTGLRSGALGGARASDFNVIDPKALRRGHAAPELLRLAQAGVALGTLRVKTKGVVRTVPLAGLVVELLLERKRLVEGCHDHLFPGYGLGGLTALTLNRSFKRIRDQVELPRNHHANDLRHSAITLMRLAGASWIETTEMAGHKNPETTRRVYDHTDVTPTGFALANRYSSFLGVGHG